MLSSQLLNRLKRELGNSLGLIVPFSLNHSHRHLHLYKEMLEHDPPPGIVCYPVNDNCTHLEARKIMLSIVILALYRTKILLIFFFLQRH
jgi:hypothetical protein